MKKRAKRKQEKQTNDFPKSDFFPQLIAGILQVGNETFFPYFFFHFLFAFNFFEGGKIKCLKREREKILNKSYKSSLNYTLHYSPERKNTI